MTKHLLEENGWNLEADTEVRRSLLKDEELAKLLDGSDEPPEEGPPKRRRWILRVLVSVALLVLIASSFVLGMLYSENTQLKDESTKLVDEKGLLDEKVVALGGTVAQCREELTLCAEDVDLLQELADYDLNPKERYGEGYDELKRLRAKRDTLDKELKELQASIEKKVSGLWRPSRQPKKFWADFKRDIREKRKLTRKLKRLDKKYQGTLAEMDKALFEKKVRFKERIKEKNTHRRTIAVSLETDPEGRSPRSEAGTPQDGSSSKSAPAPKEGLASVVP